MQHGSQKVDGKHVVPQRHAISAKMQEIFAMQPPPCDSPSHIFPPGPCNYYSYHHHKLSRSNPKVMGDVKYNNPPLFALNMDTMDPINGTQAFGREILR